MTTVEPDTLRLAAIVTACDDAIVSHSPEGIIETWNPAAERLFGYSGREAVGRPVTMLLAPESRHVDHDVINDLRRGTTVAHYEATGIHRNGTRRSLSLAVSPLVTPEGNMVGVARVIRDVSEQKAAERQVARLAAIVDSSADAIVSKDLNGMVQTWNRAAERLFGYSADEMIGASIARVIPEDRLAEEEEVLARIRRGEAIEQFETVRIRKDGGTIHVLLSVSPIRDARGTVIGASKIARDVSHQRRLEREARHLAAIVESSDDAIVSKDLNGVVQTWNPAAARMFGYEPEEIIGHSIRRIIPADRQEEEDRVLASLRRGEAVSHFETIRQRKDGTLIEISLTVSPVRAADGRIIGASKIARDISDQRRLARAAEEANRVKDDFLAMLSHELRTPLNAVLGYTRMLRVGGMPGERRDHAIDIIERNAQVLSQLVSDVLDVSTIVTGKVRLKVGVCDLAGTLRAAVDVVVPSAQSKRVTLDVQDHDGPLLVNGDADRIQQVFWNVLANAVKFTPEGGRVTVTMARDARHARIVVADTGVGIAAGDLPYIFRQFWQGERQPGTRAGLGLGLALARHFTELHGGSIDAESRGLGEGATFTIRLPLRPA